MDGQGIWHVREKRNVYGAFLEKPEGKTPFERWHGFEGELENKLYKSIMGGDGLDSSGTG